MMRREVVARAPARARQHPIQRKRARQYGKPPVAARMHAPRGPQVCERCHAVYENRSWRAGGRGGRRPPPDATWTLCPACTQVADEEYFGRVRVSPRLPGPLEVEVRRRVWNVERRARYTQPERRLVRMDRAPDGLEILTTSQKLAHRIARELKKAFGGRVRYNWMARDGLLEATWEPKAARA